ncbi:UNVERIFIED_CONTAM: hypothetical protein FKN15_036118 [Acipenser sinensis]
MSHQLLCACEFSLRITGECSALIELIEQNIDALSEDFPSSQVIVGLSLLLLQAPANQQTPILDLALKIIAPSETQLLLSTAPILVMPLLQIISSAAVMEVLSDSQISTSNQQLALTLQHTVQGQMKEEKRLTMQPPKSYNVGGQRSSRAAYRQGRWRTVSRGHPGRPNPLSPRAALGQLSAAPWKLPSSVGKGIAWTQTRDVDFRAHPALRVERLYWMRHSGAP